MKRSANEYDEDEQEESVSYSDRGNAVADSMKAFSNFMLLVVTVVSIVASTIAYFFTIAKPYLWGLFGFFFIVALINKLISYTLTETLRSLAKKID